MTGTGLSTDCNHVVALPATLESSALTTPKFRIVQGRGLGERKHTHHTNRPPQFSTAQPNNLFTPHNFPVQENVGLIQCSYQSEASQFAFPNSQYQHPVYQSSMNGFLPGNTPQTRGIFQYERNERLRAPHPVNGYSELMGLTSIYSYDNKSQYNTDSMEQGYPHMYPVPPQADYFPQSNDLSVNPSPMKNRFMHRMDGQISPGSYYSTSPRNSCDMQQSGSNQPQHLPEQRFGGSPFQLQQQVPFLYEYTTQGGMNSVQPTASYSYPQQHQKRKTCPTNSTNAKQPTNLQNRRSAKLLPLDLKGPSVAPGDNSTLMGLLNSSPPCTIPEMERIAHCLSFFRSLVTLTRKDSMGFSTAYQDHLFNTVKNSIVSLLYADTSVDEFAVSMSTFMTPDMMNKTIPILRVTISALRSAVTNGNINTDCIIQGNQSGSDVYSAAVPNEAQPAVQQEAKSAEHSMHTSKNQADTDACPTAPGISHVVSNEQSQYSSASDSSQLRTGDDGHMPVTRSLSNKEAEMFANKNEILGKIFERLPRSCDISESAIGLISDALEHKMSEIASGAISLASHRLTSFRSPEHYAVIDDTKSQLQYIEKLERSHSVMRCEPERNTTPDLDSLVQKVHTINEQVEATRANETALEALGKSSTVFECAEVAYEPRNARPRALRVNMRDLHLYLSSSRHSTRSHTVQKIAFGL